VSSSRWGSRRRHTPPPRLAALAARVTFLHAWPPLLACPSGPWPFTDLPFTDLPSLPAEYSNDLGDFLAQHDLADMAHVTSLQDLRDKAATIEAAFCTNET
jgi:hypothetical protein